MPYEWLSDRPEDRRLHLWPHRSLTQAGFVAFIAITALLILVPVTALLGTPLLWLLLPFPALVLAAMWLAIRRNQRDTEIIEDLHLTPDRVTLRRTGPGGKRQEWEANPHWVRLTLHPSAGPVPHYLTLRGNGREVELGAFLSEEERIALHGDLTRRLGGHG